MKVKAIRNYKDKELNKSIKTDEVIEVTEERADVLLKANVVEIVQKKEVVIETAIPEQKKEKAVVKKSKKKKNVEE